MLFLTKNGVVVEMSNQRFRTYCLGFQLALLILFKQYILRYNDHNRNIDIPEIFVST